MRLAGLGKETRRKRRRPHREPFSGGSRARRRRRASPLDRTFSCCANRRQSNVGLRADRQGAGLSNAWSDEAPFYGGVSVAAAATAFSGYATAYETASALTVTTYAARLSGWPENLEFTIAVIADIHAYYPWMSEERVGDIVDLVNAQSPISPSCSETPSARIASYPGMCRRRRGGAGCPTPSAPGRLFDPRQSRLMVGRHSDRPAGQFAQRAPGARRGRHPRPRIALTLSGHMHGG